MLKEEGHLRNGIALRNLMRILIGFEMSQCNPGKALCQMYEVYRIGKLDFLLFHYY